MTWQFVNKYDPLGTFNTTEILPAVLSVIVLQSGSGHFLFTLDRMNSGEGHFMFVTCGERGR